MGEREIKSGCPVCGGKTSGGIACDGCYSRVDVQAIDKQWSNEPISREEYCLRYREALYDLGVKLRAEGKMPGLKRPDGAKPLEGMRVGGLEWRISERIEKMRADGQTPTAIFAGERAYRELCELARAATHWPATEAVASFKFLGLDVHHDLNCPSAEAFPSAPPPAPPRGIAAWMPPAGSIQCSGDPSDRSGIGVTLQPGESNGTITNGTKYPVTVMPFGVVSHGAIVGSAPPALVSGKAMELKAREAATAESAFLAALRDQMDGAILSIHPGHITTGEPRLDVTQAELAHLLFAQLPEVIAEVERVGERAERVREVAWERTMPEARKRAEGMARGVFEGAAGR